MRFSGGSANCRRICSTSARSLSRLSADGLVTTGLAVLGVFFFMQRASENREDGNIL